MKLPWKRARNGGRLAIGCGGGHFAWLRADARGRLEGGGLVTRDGAGDDEFERRIRALGLAGADTVAVLDLDAVQLLQIDAPAVRPEEMKAAARWHIRERIEGHLDDLTIDVLQVGAPGADRAQHQLFVAAARNDDIRSLTQRCEALGLGLSAIDITETVQRNLQTAAADAAGFAGRASAALVRYGQHGLLTICAGGELYETRRLPWDDDGVAPAVDFAAPVPSEIEGLDFVDYGAMSGSAPGVGAGDGAPRLVIELQRSFDVWERSWPDLPLAGLWLYAGSDTAAVSARLASQLNLPLHAIDPDAVLPGFDAAAINPAHRDALLPLAGALRREESRAL